MLAPYLLAGGIVKRMIVELVQMTLAIGLLGVGIVLFGITQLARQGTVINLKLPVWARWGVSVCLFLMVIGGLIQLT